MEQQPAAGKDQCTFKPRRITRKAEWVLAGFQQTENRTRGSKGWMGEKGEELCSSRGAKLKLPPPRPVPDVEKVTAPRTFRFTASQGTWICLLALVRAQESALKWTIVAEGEGK